LAGELREGVVIESGFCFPLPQDEDTGEESQHVEGKIDHHKGAATPLGGGGRIRIHGGMDREKA